MKKQPNILFIISDQHTPDITGCYGNSIVQTPNLDRLAQEGTVFENAYCNFPLCVPSRMSFMTGRHPFNINVYGNGDVLDSRIPTYAHMCTGAGYRTVLAGRMHFVGGDQYHGFQERLFGDYTSYAFHNGKVNRYNPLKGLLGRSGGPDPFMEVGMGSTCTIDMDRRTTDETISWLKDYKEHDGKNPFMMTLGYFNPHCPYIAPKKYYKRYYDKVEATCISPDEYSTLHPVHRNYVDKVNKYEVPKGNFKKATVAYYGLVNYMDDLIGEVLSTLTALDLEEDTIIIYSSDHGEMLGEHGRWHKSCFYDASVKVPFVVKIPGSLQSGRLTERISLVDLFPTVLDFAGVDYSFKIDGKSLVPLLTQKNVPWDNTIKSELVGSRMVIKNNMKLCYYKEYEFGELYDLNLDPDEKLNLYDHRDYHVVKEALLKEVYADLWSPVLSDNHNKEMERIGYRELTANMSKSQNLVESGIINVVPGYNTEMNTFGNYINTKNSDIN